VRLDTQSDNFKSGNIDPNDQLVITDGKEVVNTADTEAKIARAQDVEDSLSGEISKSHKQAQVYKDLRAALKFERGLAPGGKGAKAGLGMSQARNENDSVNNVRLRTEVIRLKDSMTQEVKSKNPNALKNIDSSNN